MKPIRLFGALALCLSLICLSTSALAASKAATTRPTVKISTPKSAVRGGVGDDITITPSAPGFLTLKLLGEDGMELLIICENAEVHTSKNVIEFDARDAEGAPLATGTYQLSASVVDQYGNVSKTVTAAFKVGAPLPSLTNVVVSASKAFKLSVSYDADFSAGTKKSDVASVEFSLHRTQPKSKYVDDFSPDELTAPQSSSTDTLDLNSGCDLPSAAGFYKIKGSIMEYSTGVDGDLVEVDFVVDMDGAVYMLNSAPEDVLASVNAYVEAIEFGTYTPPSENETVAEASSEKQTKEQPAQTQASEQTEKKATVEENSLAYASSDCETGDEGLQIGAGVSDFADQTDAGYWTLTSDATSEQIWQAITRTMVSVDVSEKESAYIYDSPEENRKSIGTVSGLTQGLNVIKEREDGWSLVEAYRNEDGAFVRGYVRSNRLRVTEPNTTYGIVVDKKTQTLTVWKDGAPIGSCTVTTGLATEKYLHRETPAGEYVLATRRGTTEYYGNGFSKYTIRLSGNYHLCEIPTTKKNGSDFSLLEEALGTKATRGHICVAHEASSDGGINAAWIWEMTDTNKRVKVLILDDKDRSVIPVGE